MHIDLNSYPPANLIQPNNSSPNLAKVGEGLVELDQGMGIKVGRLGQVELDEGMGIKVGKLGQVWLAQLSGQELSEVTGAQ